MRIRTAVAASAALAGSVVVLPLALPPSAAADVTVKADDTSPGGSSKLTFRVPNESETAGTTRVAVMLPTEAPFASVSVRPVPGWTAELQRQPLAAPQQVGDLTLDELVTGVVWTAQPGVQIGPGQFEEFELAVGPLPEEAGTLSFPAEQGYSDGTTVLWDQFTPAGGEEPERPAPTIEVGGSAEAEDGKGRTDEEKAARREERQAAKATATDRPRKRDAAAAADAGGDSGGDGAARALGATGLVLGAAGLGLGGYAYVRSRKSEGAGAGTGSGPGGTPGPTGDGTSS
jgi:uncharacterized protein YcnI